jgi:hypothetical protein
MTTGTLDPFPKAAPRKRRRRAPATGAADDCFTCSNLQVKCDRRRPYCSQCLDNGKECAGYKTTLTWGVGVASRGKLRGLSLPIPGNKNMTSNQTSKKRNTVPEGERRSPSQSITSPQQASDFGSQNATLTSSAFNFTPTEPNLMPNMPRPPAWQSAIPTTQPFFPPYPKADLHDLQPLHVPMSAPYEEHSLPPSAGSIGAYGQSGFASPVVYTAGSDETFNLPILTQAGNFQQNGWRPMQENVLIDDHGTTSWPRNSLSSSVGSSLSSRDFNEPLIKTSSYDHQRVGFLDELGHEIKEEREDEDVEEIYHGNTINPYDQANGDVHLTLSPFGDNFSLSQIVPSFGIGKTPRLKYLINYYAEVISPVIVAFDGPSNPYRTHILPLAMKSETLQHAIAALSASNLRIRKEQNAISTGKTLPARRSSIAHSSLTDEKWQQQLLFLHSEDPSREELYHKGVSIQSLNAQLADPARRKDDSILATLLILCLFHICDTGVAKFKTQFAGVKKLLALRGNELDAGTKETKWYTRMFTWFDTFTATVNDREGQLNGSHLDMASLSDEEWSMENLAGCDGRLFKIIAKLGRLNVLSQNKPVEDGSPPPIRVPRARPFFPSTSLPGDSHLFDGNGWASLLADEDLFNTHDDSRAQFWREWKDIRQSLEEWELDMSFYDPTCVEICGPNQVDLSNISESFRFSALLYTERLAFPQLPSSHPKIQSFVVQALHFITEVKSDVYLLWPLFITGSECVDERHRSIVRQRCLDIQKDSGFFNNISCLELLEKIWRENKGGGVDVASGMKLGGQGFRWRKAMRSEGGDGEYIVV